MSPIVRTFAAALLSTAVASGAFAGASSSNFQYAPDPALKTATPADLEVRIHRTCTATQAKLLSTPESMLQRPCRCYASRTLRGLDAAELDAYRNTGVFNETARAKALAALDKCKLRRPA